MSRKGPRRSGKVGSLTIREAAERIYVHREPMVKVAKAAGVTYEAVRNAFRRYEYPLPHHRMRRAKPIPGIEFENARRRGWTKTQLAAHLGTGLWRVLRDQKRVGFSWPERDGIRSNTNAKRWRGVRPKQRD